MERDRWCVVEAGDGEPPMEAPPGDVQASAGGPPRVALEAIEKPSELVL